MQATVTYNTDSLPTVNTSTENNLGTANIKNRRRKRLKKAYLLVVCIFQVSLSVDV